ncbi:hypothetical protein CBR_g21815 [Chara braunii]|uniref:Uncharacterized protein n=1 Tax=Chara braunii TaxID=69332 RepID=A0A388JUJ6_CHABU|nr:hypothetical protein CBR_g21815 [Chara braunii]|eukprot:GBG61471.1 hypothetical protein CBR_g21815 [Chara braunii]
MTIVIMVGMNNAVMEVTDGVTIVTTEMSGKVEVIDIILSVERDAARSTSPGRTGQGDNARAANLEPLHSKVVEIGKSVAAVCQFVEIERENKAAKEKWKADRKEAAERLENERREAELKKKRKEKKLRQEAERVESMKKELDIKVAMQGKQKQVCHGSSDSGSIANSSETEEINTKTRNLSISEKRKRAEEPVFEDNTPMKLPPKRTPLKMSGPGNLSARFTHSRTRNQTKTPTPRKTPSSIRKKKIPASIGAVGRLKFKKQVLHESKCLDALVLHNMCKKVVIPYNGKFEAIFDIAAHRTHVMYGTDEEDEVETTNEVEPDDATVREDVHEAVCRGFSVRHLWGIVDCVTRWRKDISVADAKIEEVLD